MAGILTAAQGAQAFLKDNREKSIDNWTFKCFYQYTTTLHFVSSFLVTANQFFGDPIQCDLPGGGVSGPTLRSYCWMYSTFNIPQDFQGNCAKRPTSSSFSYQEGEDRVFNSFYQWVSLCLMGQGFLFYLPRAIWLSQEGGLMKHLAKGKSGKVIEDAEEKCEELVITFNQHLHNKYCRYFNCFILCESLNLAIVLLQIFLSDQFLGGGFLSYGRDVYTYYSSPPEENMLLGRYNPMCQLFPRVATCSYYQYGGGGGQITLSALCILALNIIIDKVYLVLWWWYGLLVICGTIKLIERALQFFSGDFRFYLMKIRMHRYFKDCQETENIRRYIKESSYGDWFVLYQMSKNLNRRLFFMFLKATTKTPRWQLERLLPQIKVINAFKGETKENNVVTHNKWKNPLAFKTEPKNEEIKETEILNKKEKESPEKKESNEKRESPEKKESNEKKESPEKRDSSKVNRKYSDDEDEDNSIFVRSIKKLTNTKGKKMDKTKTRAQYK